MLEVILIISRRSIALPSTKKPKKISLDVLFHNYCDQC